MANRLAANPEVSVAAIEAGSFYEVDNGNISQIPAFDAEYSSSSPATTQPLVDWGIVTVPQKVFVQATQRQLYSATNDCLIFGPQQLDGREIHYTQGKCLGGR